VIKKAQRKDVSSVAAATYLGVALKILTFSACAMISARKGGVSGSLKRPQQRSAGIGPGSVVGNHGDHRESAKTLNFAASSTLPCPAN
jgi:hypothetical protein